MWTLRGRKLFNFYFEFFLSPGTNKKKKLKKRNMRKTESGRMPLFPFTTKAKK